MKKLNLNKKTIAALDQNEMSKVNGGFLSIFSCSASIPQRGCCRHGSYNDGLAEQE